MPPERTVLVYDCDNYVTVHTRAGFNLVSIDRWTNRSPEESVQDILKSCPPSTISATYINPGNASYNKLKRLLAAFKAANYSNVSLINGTCLTLSAMLNGTDCQFNVGETILCFLHEGPAPDDGISAVLKKVDNLFQITEHMGETLSEILYYYPEIKKVVVKTEMTSVSWSTVFPGKIVKLSHPTGTQQKYLFDDQNYEALRRIKLITRIRVLFDDGKNKEPLNLVYELIPVTKTIELIIPPERHEINVWCSYNKLLYNFDSVLKLDIRPGCITKVAITTTVDETIIPQFSLKVIAYIPQVFYEIVFDSTTGLYAGNLIKVDSQKNIAACCVTPDDVFAAFESLQTTDHHVGFIINYKNKFEMTVHKAIMSLIPEHNNVWVIPLHTALNVDLRHSGAKIDDEEVVVFWYQNTNSDVFYVKKCNDQSLDMTEKIKDRAVKKVIVVTKNVISKTLTQTVQKRFPAATIFNSNRKTLPPKAHHEVAWDLLRNRRSDCYNMAPYSLGIRLVITSNDTTVNIDKEKDYDISCWTEILPVDKAGGVLTVDMKHYALEDPVRLHELKIESSKNNREAVIQMSIRHQFVAQVDMTLQKKNAKNTAKNNKVIYTTFLIASGYGFQAIYQHDFDAPATTFATFEALVTHIASLAPVSSVIAVIDFVVVNMTLEEGRSRRETLLAAGFTKIIPWNMFQLTLEECKIVERFDHGECLAIFTDYSQKIFIRQSNNVKCLANINIYLEYFDKFKVRTVVLPLSQMEDGTPGLYMPRDCLRYPIHAPYISRLWNTYWAIANGKSVVMPSGSLEFIIDGARQTVFKTGRATLPHEFTVEIDVETADNINIIASWLHRIALEEPRCIATFDTTSLHDRIIAITITVKDMYNVTAKFKAFAPGHKKRVITRIVLMKQGETGIDRQTFSRGDKASVSDFALPSMLVALETYAHPELSAVIFITSKQNLTDYNSYIELAQRFRFADTQICHEAVIEANRLLYGSEIDADVGETMFIMNSSRHSKNFNKSYVIKKEANRFKLLKPEADTIENLRNEFPEVTRITYEGLNPIVDDDTGSSLYAYLFARIDGTLRRTAVDDIETPTEPVMPVLTKLNIQEFRTKRPSTVVGEAKTKRKLTPPITPVYKIPQRIAVDDTNVKANVVPPKPALPKPMDEIKFIIKFGNNETSYTLKRDTFKQVILDVGNVTKIEMFAKNADSNQCFNFPSCEFIAVDGRRITLELKVNSSLIATIKCYTTYIVFKLTNDNRLLVYNTMMDMNLLAEHPAYISFKHSTPRCGYGALEDQLSNPEAVAHDLHYILSEKFDPENPKKEWKFKVSLDYKQWIVNIQLGNQTVTPVQLLTIFLHDILVKEQQKLPLVIDRICFLVPEPCNLWPEQTKKIGDALKVNIHLEWVNSDRKTPTTEPSTRKKKKCTVM